MRRLGINGFGRIGRAVARANQLKGQFDLVAINDINPHIENMAYLLKYDSTYGRYPVDVFADDQRLVIDGDPVAYSSEQQISDVSWSAQQIDVLVDSSGIAKNIELARELVSSGGVSKVIVTHSSERVDNEVVMGVNCGSLSSDDKIVSNSICDANAIAHVMKWISDEYGVETGAVTTLHPWLSYQNIVDGPAISQSNPGVVWTDFALGRSSVSSVIPKNTTAMAAVEKVVPELKGKVMSFSYRIPTGIVASSDLTVQVKRAVCQDEIIKFLKAKIDESPYVTANTESLISHDYEGRTESAIVDLQWVKVRDNMIKVVLWYDNEYGYSSRVLDLAAALLKL